MRDSANVLIVGGPQHGALKAVPVSDDQPPPPTLRHLEPEVARWNEPAVPMTGDYKVVEYERFEVLTLSYEFEWLWAYIHPDTPPDQRKMAFQSALVGAGLSQDRYRLFER